MSAPTLTRGEALDLIDAAEGDAEMLSALALAWIGHDEFDGTLEETAETLRLCVMACCLSDSDGSRGPRDSDDTGLPEVPLHPAFAKAGAL